MGGRLWALAHILCAVPQVDDLNTFCAGPNPLDDHERRARNHQFARSALDACSPQLGGIGAIDPLGHQYGCPDRQQPLDLFAQCSRAALPVWRWRRAATSGSSFTFVRPLEVFRPFYCPASLYLFVRYPFGARRIRFCNSLRDPLSQQIVIGARLRIRQRGNVRRIAWFVVHECPWSVKI